MRSNGTATGSIALNAATTQIVVRARGQVCRGAPHVTVAVDGSQVLSADVSSGTYADYPVAAALAVGKHAIAVSFTNDLQVKGICDRNLFVDSLSFVASATTTASPDMALSASPDLATAPASLPAPVITSFSPAADDADGAFAVYGNGTTASDEVLLRGTAAVGSTVSIFDGSTALGTTLTDSKGQWAFATPTLGDQLHALSATAALKGSTSPASAALDVTVVADITAFNAAPNAKVDEDGAAYVVENASRSWSLEELDSHTLRFEVRSGDYSNIDTANDRERSELDGSPTLFSPGTTIDVSYEFMVEPGAAITARYLAAGQFHDYNVSPGSPPFQIDVTGDHMSVVVDWLSKYSSSLTPFWTNTFSGGTASWATAYHDANPIVRGHFYKMNISVKFDPTNGFLRVWRDGVQLVSYTGPLGVGAQTYWKHGIYRGPAAETTAIQYRNLLVKQTP
jgi:hypothetical protein